MYIKTNVFECGRTVSPEIWVEYNQYLYNRFYFVEKGSAVFSDGNSETILKEKHIYILPSKYYSVSTNGDDIFTHCWFHLFIPNIYEDIISYDVSKDPLIKMHCELLSRFVGNNLMHNNATDIAGPFYMPICDIFNSLFNILNMKVLFIKGYSSQVADCINYINDNISTSLTNKDLANFLHLQTNYFIFIFNKEVGISPHQYVQQIRIAKAIQHIRNGETISRASNLVGYADLSTFYRAFKKQLKQSPSHIKNTDIKP